MSLVQPTQLAAVLVAIGIAKLRHEVLIEAPGWKNGKRMILPNTSAEFRLFADFLHGLRHPVRVVFEATGNYHRPLAHFLQTEGFHLELIASLAVARTREAMAQLMGWHVGRDLKILSMGFGPGRGRVRRRPTPKALKAKTHFLNRNTKEALK